MIETLGLMADIAYSGDVRDPFGFVQQVETVQGARLWRKGKGGSAVYLGAGGWSLKLVTAKFGADKGALRAVLEGNLTRLLYGEVGKSLTLPSGEVADGVDALIGKGCSVLPMLMPRTRLAYRPFRADASVTVAMAGDDAALLFAGAEKAIRAMDTARRRSVVQSAHSIGHHETRESYMRLYDKGVEANWAKAGWPAELAWVSPGRLVRLEVQDTARTARKLYGGSAEDLAKDGGEVAKQRVSRWAEDIGPVLGSYGIETIVYRLKAAGMDAEKAYGLAAAAQVLGNYGLPRLIADGVARSTAYRWAAEIRAALDTEPDGVGVLFDVQDALLASSYFERVNA